MLAMPVGARHPAALLHVPANQMVQQLPPQPPAPAHAVLAGGHGMLMATPSSIDCANAAHVCRPGERVHPNGQADVQYTPIPHGAHDTMPAMGCWEALKGA